MDQLVSIIIPVYNREKAIGRCLDSVARQSYGKSEILVIDDGSCDGTGAVCDAFAQKDRRVKVFHRQNHGVSASRNFGLEQARGRYVLFIDSDDKINESYVEGLVRAAEAGNYDLTVSDIVMVNENGKERIEMNQLALAGEITADYYLLQKITGGVWAKLYSLPLIKKCHILFHEDMAFSEDRVFNIEYYSHVKTFGTAGSSLYFYSCQSGGLSGVRSEAAFHSELKKIRMERKFLYAENIQQAERIMGNACIGALRSFGILRGTDETYAGFVQRAKEILEASGKYCRPESIKGRLGVFLCRCGLYYPIYWYCRKKPL